MSQHYLLTLINRWIHGVTYYLLFSVEEQNFSPRENMLTVFMSIFNMECAEQIHALIYVCALSAMHYLACICIFGKHYINIIF